MEQNNMQKNQNQSFFQKNQNYIIAGIIVVLLVIYFATQKPAPSDQQTTEETSTEQTTSEEEKTSEETKQTEENKQESTTAETQPETNETQTPESEPAKEASKPETTSPVTTESGNIMVTGKLMQSDNLSRGNLMVQKGGSKYYISTKRDFAPWINKEVTMEAKGELKNYTFIGIKEASAMAQNTPDKPGIDTTAKGGTNESPATKPEETVSGSVSFAGKLEKSDNESKGNYMINSDKGKVYVKTGKDFSPWVGQEVNAQATGSLQNFSALVISKK